MSILKRFKGKPVCVWFRDPDADWRWWTLVDADDQWVVLKGRDSPKWGEWAGGSLSASPISEIIHIEVDDEAVAKRRGKK